MQGISCCFVHGQHMLGAFSCNYASGWPGVRPGGRVTFLVCPKKSNQKKGPLTVRRFARAACKPVPCAARCAGRARKLGPCGPSNKRARLPPAPLRCSALSKGSLLMNTCANARQVETIHRHRTGLQRDLWVMISCQGRVCARDIPAVVPLADRIDRLRTR